MPVAGIEDFRIYNQDEFGVIAYEVIGHSFQIHNRWGRLFDEEIYQHELAQRLGNRAEKEVCIEAHFADFCKTYFIDLLVDQGGIFELKTVDRLTDEHRAQLLNYLLLTGSRHGKLINFRPERIEHEFVNTSLSYFDRTNFEVDDSWWDSSLERSSEFRSFVEELVRDWGSGLDLQLYTDAVVHFLGGEEKVLRDIEIISNGNRIGRKKGHYAAKDTLFKFTALSDSLESFESHTQRFLAQTNLQHLYWINITLRQVTFKTLSRIKDDDRKMD